MGDMIVFPGKVVRGAEMATVIPKGDKFGIVWFAGVPSRQQLEQLVEALSWGGRGNMFTAPLTLVMYGDDQGITWTILSWAGYPLSGRYLNEALARILPAGSALATLPAVSWETVRALPVLDRLSVA